MRHARSFNTQYIISTSFSPATFLNEIKRRTILSVVFFFLRNHANFNGRMRSEDYFGSQCVRMPCFYNVL